MFCFINKSKCTDEIPNAALSTRTMVSTRTRSSPVAASKKSVDLDSVITKASSVTSDSWWCVHTAMKNHSTSSSKDTDFHLKQIFLSDPVVKKFSCGETKATFLVVLRVAPYLKAKLLDQASRETFSLLLDESLNKSTEMDFNAKFWLNG